MSCSSAYSMAQELNTDLVELNPGLKPPLVQIVELGKLKYEEKKRLAQIKRNNPAIETKEIKFHPSINAHDLNIKVNHIKDHLDDGNKVKIIVQFRGREIAHPEEGKKVLESVMTAISGSVIVESQPQLEAKILSCTVRPVN